MTMDLWYDLAIRERPDRDLDVVEPDELENAEKERPTPPPPRASVAVDFF